MIIKNIVGVLDNKRESKKQWEVKYREREIEKTEPANLETTSSI